MDERTELLLKHGYLDSPSEFKIFAHRGFTFSQGTVVRDENSLESFDAAVAAGADYLELDIQCSADGVAVIFHDEKLDRVSSQSGLVSERTWIELQQVRLNYGGRIPSFGEVLTKFSNSKINIDVKASGAIPDLVRSLQNSRSEGRVLITSFSERRRKAALRQVPGVATSPSALLTLRIRLSYMLHIGLTRALKNVNVLQIPVSYGILRLDSPRFIEAVKRRGVEVFYWTVNDPVEAIRLKGIGANGIVTDRTDLMVSAFHSQ